MTNRFDSVTRPLSVIISMGNALRLLLFAALVMLAACQPPATAAPTETPTAVPTVDARASTTALAVAAAATTSAHATATSVVITRIAEGVATAVRATANAQATATSAQATANAHATATERARPTATPTATVTPTPTHAATRRPTAPPQPTATPTPAVARYYQSSCASYHKDISQAAAGWAMINWCLVYVELHPDSMEFYMTWEVTELHGMTSFWKFSDAERDDLYLEDQFGTRYSFFAVTGAAGRMVFEAHVPYGGSYFFPLPTNGAKTFTFWDRGNDGAIVYAALP